MIQMNRRKLIGGLGLLIAAPAIVKAANIMRVKAWDENPCATILFDLPGAHTISLPCIGGHGYLVGDVVTLTTGGLFPDGTLEVRPFYVVDVNDKRKGVTLVKQEGKWVVTPEKKWMQIA